MKGRGGDVQGEGKDYTRATREAYSLGLSQSLNYPWEDSHKM